MEVIGGKHQLFCRTKIFSGLIFFLNKKNDTDPHRNDADLHSATEIMILIQYLSYGQCCGSETKVSDLISDPDPACR
jgi:hypothetical protein